MPQRVTDGLVDRLAISSNLVQLTLDEARNLPVLWRSLALDLRDSRAECAKWRECAEALAGALRHNLIGHYYCEDSWYSCPKATDGCSNDGAGDDCNCGAAERLTVANAALARFDAMKKEAGEK